MAEDGAEHTEVEAAAISGANDGLTVQLVGDTETGGKEFIVGLHVHVETRVALAGDGNFTGREADKTTIPCLVDGLWAVVLPAQTVVQGELAVDTPLVLSEEEVAVLCFAGVERVGDVALEAGDVAHQERSEAGTTTRGTLRARSVEVELAGAVTVRRDSQIQSAAEIGTELNRVVTRDLRPVVDELELLFVLDERAVAAVDAEGVAELEQVVAVAVDEESGHTRGKVRVQVHTGDAGVFCRRGANTVRLAKDVITDITKTEIGEQVRPHIVIEASGNGVIPGVGSAGVGAGGTRGVQTRTACNQTEGAGGHHLEVLHGVAAEGVDLIRQVVIAADVEGMVVEADASGRGKVGLIEDRRRVGGGD